MQGWKISLSMYAVQDANIIQVYQSMSALARELCAVNLAQGIPAPVYDAEWRSAVRAELSQAHFQYTPSRGIPELREAICSLYRVGAGNAIVTSGCTESLVAALLGWAALGCTEVVWLEPFYSYYPGLARIAGMRHRSVSIDLSGDKPRLRTEWLRTALASARDRAVLLLNTPHNPSGLALDTKTWDEVLDVVSETGCRLLVDDAYRDFRYGPPAPPYAALLDTGQAAIAGSVSKSFAATGLRIGWLFSPAALDPYAENAHMHLSNCAPDLVQRAATRLVRQVSMDGRVAETTKRYRRKRDQLVTALADAGLTTVLPEGGHFIMARLPGEGRSGFDIAQDFARTVGVVPLPLESFFTAPRQSWLRFSFAVADDDLTEACRRLTQATGLLSASTGTPRT